MAEGAVRIRSRREGPLHPSWRVAAYLTAAVGNNLPDLDFVYSGIIPRPLGYLLHHRGHTHTVVAALGFALIMLAVVATVARQQRLAWSRTDWSWLVALAALSPLVHIAMDFSNNYGVHPFWPVYDGWMYGDAVFILEPLFWAVAIPPLFFAMRSVGARFVLGTLLVLAIGLCWNVSFIPFGNAMAITVLAAVSTVASWRAGPELRIAIGVFGSWALVALFFLASRSAKATMRRSVAAEGLAIADVIATPTPANPLCFAMLAIGTRGNDYAAIRATVATVPSWVPADHCPRDPDEHPTAPFAPIALPPSPAIWYRGEFVAPLVDLVQLERMDCRAAAFLRFARAPYWTTEITGDTIIGDLRYDRHPGLDFADLRLKRGDVKCPTWVPPWLPPRRALWER
jgi:inner membrane protein